MLRGVLAVALVAGCAASPVRLIPELPGQLNVRVRLGDPPEMTNGNPMVYVRYFVSVANGTDVPVTLDSVEMEGSFFTRRTTNSYREVIAPHGQTTVTFAANGFTEAPAARPISREPAMDRPLPALPHGPPSMLIIVHVTDRNGSRRETFEQAIAGH
jgi:hypothetical protein